VGLKGRLQNRAHDYFQSHNLAPLHFFIVSTSVHLKAQNQLNNLTTEVVENFLTSLITF